MTNNDSSDNSIELLAPAGSVEMAYAVTDAGADAVYFAGEAFGARAYAPNFSRHDAAVMLDHLHSKGRRAYLAVNTLLKNLEIERKLFESLRFFYNAGVDAVLVQDFGVLSLIREYFPDLCVHASTQMNVASCHGASFLAGLGVNRAVLARELSVSEIQKICSAGVIEVEVFVHGALCVCYSGQCLMSSFLGGRSGNRGRCAQPCRLPYDIISYDRKRVKAPGAYVLSPKDLCTIDVLPELIDAGVKSLKIEGRMKQVDYAGTVTSVYRRYIDAYYENPEAYKVSDRDKKALLDSGSRDGFTHVYMDGHFTTDMMSYKKSSHEHTKSEHAAGPGNIKGGKFSSPRSGFKYASEAGALRGIPSAGLMGTKDVDTEFLAAGFHRDYDAAVGLDFKPMLHNKRISEKGTSGRDELPVYVRILTPGQLQTVDKSFKKARIIIPARLAVSLESIKDNYIIALPVVMREKNSDLYADWILKHRSAKYEVSSYDALGFLTDLGVECSDIYGGMRLYQLSDRAKAAFSGLGLCGGFVPVELSEKELLHRDNSNDRLLIYGRIPLMYMANCIAMTANGRCMKNRIDRSVSYYLKDRKGKAFPVQTDCVNCVNIIYNAVHTDLIDLYKRVCALRPGGVEISFTTESSREMREIQKRYEGSKNGERAAAPRGDFTRGHFNKSIM